MLTNEVCTSSIFLNVHILDNKKSCLSSENVSLAEGRRSSLALPLDCNSLTSAVSSYYAYSKKKYEYEENPVYFEMIRSFINEKVIYPSIKRLGNLSTF